MTERREPSPLALTFCSAVLLAAFAASLEAAPEAVILRAGPDPARTGEPVELAGALGGDAAAESAGFLWRSDLDGALGDDASITVSTLSRGTHRLELRVRGPAGDWSPPAITTLTVSDEESAGERGADVIIDDTDPGATRMGAWSASVVTGWYRRGSLHAPPGSTTSSHTFTATLEPGVHEVLLWWTASPDRDGDVPVSIAHEEGDEEIRIDQRCDGGRWNSLGRWRFDGAATVTIRATGRDATVCADAVRFIRRAELDGVRPRAVIGSVLPDPATASIILSGAGIGDGIEAYRWRSSRDGILSTEASFVWAGFSLGEHLVFLEVRDANGLWSPEAEARVRLSRPANVRPEVRIVEVSATEIAAGESVHLRAEGTDSDGRITGYRWESSLDGFLSEASELRATLTTVGEHLVSVRARDNADAWSPPASITIVVREAVQTPPVVSILSIEPRTAELGEEVAFEGSAADADPGDEVVEWLWTSDRDGELSREASFTTSGLTAGVHRVRLSARDATGLWSEAAEDVLEVLAPPPPPPTEELSVASTSVTETDVDTVVALFEVTLAPPSASTVRVRFATRDLSARAGLDYLAAAGELVFEPGETSKEVSVDVLGDLLEEDDEIFTLKLADPQNARIARGEATCTILENDASLPGLSERPSNAGCILETRAIIHSDVELVPAFPGLDVPAITLVQRPGDDSRWYALDRNGLVRWFPNSPDADSRSTVVDLRDRVLREGEGGLIGFAFHPRFFENGEVFIAYTGPGDPLITYLSRFRSADGGDTIDPGSEEMLLEIPQAGIYHKAGRLLFGPADGYLYMSCGDGSRAAWAQDLDELPGSLLRIDVDGEGPYAIPPDNPFAAGGGRGEIFAYGLRNPWGWSFDRLTGEIWVGDVGRDSREEVNRIVPGGNYGWNLREGTICQSACERDDLIAPYFEFTHDDGNAIIGGYVYRGDAIPSLHGTYVFADYGSGTVRGLFPSAGGGVEARTLGITTSKTFSFSEDQNGELFIATRDGIYKLVPAGTSGADTFPARLSELACFDPAPPSAPASGVLRYEVNVPFWSDRAVKERFLALPDGERIRIEDDGDWTLPPGTVLAKHMRLDGKLIETRIFARHLDGTWGGYSYEWDEAESDAVLLDGARTKAVGEQSWTFPSRAQCLACHTEDAGYSLGLETAQLNRSATYPSTGRTANQLTTFEAIGLFEDALAAPPGELPFLPDPEDPSIALEERARAYLHVNCSQCHRPGTGVGASMDLRYDTPFFATGLCDAEPAQDDLGVANARLVAPGDPDRSLLWLRVRSLAAERMPPISKNLVDEAGAELLRSWIASLEGCD